MLCWAMTKLGHIIPGAGHSQLMPLLSCDTVGRGCWEGLIIGLSASGFELVIAICLPPCSSGRHIGETLMQPLHVCVMDLVGGQLAGAQVVLFQRNNSGGKEKLLLL